MLHSWAAEQVVHLPGAQVSITVAVVFGISAVVFNTTGTLLYTWSWAPPVRMPLIGSSYPPGKRGSIWESNLESVYMLYFENILLTSLPLNLWLGSSNKQYHMLVLNALTVTVNHEHHISSDVFQLMWNHWILNYSMCWHLWLVCIHR